MAELCTQFVFGLQLKRKANNSVRLRRRRTSPLKTHVHIILWNFC